MYCHCFSLFLHMFCSYRVWLEEKLWNTVKTQQSNGNGIGWSESQLSQEQCRYVWWTFGTKHLEDNNHTCMMCVYIIVCKFKTYPDITCCNMYFGRVYMICTTCNLHIAMRELKVHRMPENLQIGTQSGDCVILLCKQLSHNFDHQSLS